MNEIRFGMLLLCVFALPSLAHSQNESDSPLAENTPQDEATSAIIITRKAPIAQTFSLAQPSKLNAFEVKLNTVTQPGDLTFKLHRAVDGRPWQVNPVFSKTISLTKATKRLVIKMDPPISLQKGSYAAVFQSTGNTSFSLATTLTDHYPAGSLSARTPQSDWSWNRSKDDALDLIFKAYGKAGPAPPVAASAPNIIFFLVDDMGWTDLQTGDTGPHSINGKNYGSSYYETPNIKRLATEGLSFTHCFAHPNCSPTRAAILSGQYPPRSSSQVYQPNALMRQKADDGTPNLKAARKESNEVAAEHPLFSELLQAGGYVTAHFGKYHVGNHGENGNPATMPEANGFDYNFGGDQSGAPGAYHTHNQQFNEKIGAGLELFAQDYTADYIDEILAPIAHHSDPTLILTNQLNGAEQSKHVEDAIGDAAIAFLNEVRRGPLSDHPFLMTVHSFAPHTPIGEEHARADLLKKYKEKTSTHPGHADPALAAIIEAADQSIGRVLNYLDDPNGDGDPSDSITDNTLIIFSSDNGGHIGTTSNAPLRHRKGSFYNGGLRVPLIVRQPGTIAPGTQSDRLVYSADFYATLVEIAGLNLPTNVNLDSHSFASHLTAKPKQAERPAPIFYHFPGYLSKRSRPCGVVIKRIDDTDYKLIYSYDPQYDSNPRGKVDRGDGLKSTDNPWELYEINEDLGERTNLLAEKPSRAILSIANELASDLHTWLTQEDEDWKPIRLKDASTGDLVPFAPDEVSIPR